MPAELLAAVKPLGLGDYDLRQSLLAESEMTLALANNFSSYLSLSLLLTRILFG